MPPFTTCRLPAATRNERAMRSLCQFKVIATESNTLHLCCALLFVPLVGCGKSQSNNSVSAMIKALEGSDAGARRTAAKALSKMGPEAKEAITALTGALDDQDSRTRYYAVKSLSKIGANSTAVPGLSKMLADNDAEIRYYSVKTLSKIGPSASAAVPVLT